MSASTNNVSARTASLRVPGATNVSVPVARTQTLVVTARNLSRRALLSAMAPSSGARRATTIPAMATARDHQAVPVTTSEANVCAKYAEYTNVTTSVVYGEFAQSNRHHARTRRRSSVTAGKMASAHRAR